MTPHNLELRPSPTLALNERTARIMAEGRMVHRFGFGESPFAPPDYVVEALRENAWRRNYLPVQGLPELRERVAIFHRQHYGQPFTADDVLIGPGSKELIFLLQLVYRGELLLPSPAWVSYEPQARMLNLPVTWLPATAAEGWRLSPEALDHYCAASSHPRRILILNYPNNPTGIALEEERLQALAEVARRHRLVIVSDEIYGELHHKGAHVSISRFYPEGTIVTGGLSKWCGAGGWRLGTMCVPRPLRELLASVSCAASETYSAASAPVQYAAIAAYGSEAEIPWLGNARRVLAALGRWVCQRLNDAGVRTVAPDGAYYVFPDFTGVRRFAPGLTSSELCRQLLDDAGVALLPGEHFGRPANELTCRLAYTNFDGARALAAAVHSQELDDSFVRTYCHEVVDGLEAIVGWARRHVSAGRPQEALREDV